MDDKKTAKILIKLLDKKDHNFNNDEKQALKSAIGILSWTALAKSRIKNIKDKQNKDQQWIK